jgi:hypothetical protein
MKQINQNSGEKYMHEAAWYPTLHCSHPVSCHMPGIKQIWNFLHWKKVVVCDLDYWVPKVGPFRISSGHVMIISYRDCIHVHDWQIKLSTDQALLLPVYPSLSGNITTVPTCFSFGLSTAVITQISTFSGSFMNVPCKTDTVQRNSFLGNFFTS